MEVIHPVVLPPHVVVRAGQQQQGGVAPVQPLLHGAKAALEYGALNVAQAVHLADKEHAVVQLFQCLEQHRIVLPPAQALEVWGIAAPDASLEQVQHGAVRHRGIPPSVHHTYIVKPEREKSKGRGATAPRPGGGGTTSGVSE